MKNKKLSKLKSKKYLAGVLLVLVVGVLACILKIGSLDKLKGTIKVTEAYLSNVTTKLSANISDISGEAPVVSNGYDEVKYELKYRLSASNQDRDVIITGSLDSDNGYASFKRLYGDNITSALSDNDRKIEITIRNLPADTEITTIIPIVVNGAPNGYRVNPTFKIKESTADSFTDVYTNPIEVSTNNLRGTVTNTDGNRVPNILVSVYKNKKLIRETYTNDNGEYIISDLNQDNYTVDINEEIYNVVDHSNVSVNGDTSLDIRVQRVYPFNIEVHKYITKVDVNNLGVNTIKTYDNASIVNFPVKRLTNLNGKVYYKIIVENTGEKEGIVSIIKDELPDFMEFVEEENSGFELIDGVIYDRNLEGIELMPGERVEDSLVLTIKNTSQAREYLNRVTATGEIYEHVVYLLDGNTYREEDVLEGEKIERIADPIANFGGWYTDPEYTNKYNYNNRVTKNLILYGKTTRKYTVEFYDKDPENGDEDLYDTEEVPAGDTVDEPDDHPDHDGYNFDYWCMVDGTKYIFTTPVNEDLKLVTCYTIKKFNVNFHNYEDVKEKTIQVEYKHLIDQNEAPTFDETGYTFICWTENKTDCFSFTTPVEREINLYPKHERLKNAVVFNDENRITTVNDIPYGDTVSPIADQGKEGHTFRCWSEDRTNCFDFDTPIIETKTLYAIYDINKYLVHFIDKDPETLVETQYVPDQLVEWGGFATRPVNNPEHTGYTFVEWKKDNTTYNFDTPVKSEITLVSSYRINTYPVNFHVDNDVTTVNVEYKHTVTPIADPDKEHHVFRRWLDENDDPFNFSTLIVEETDLYAEFEEILPPVISHTPTMWTNEDVTVTLTKNANVLDDTGYTYLYKLVNGSYNTYSAPFAVSENTTITAKGSKSDVDSVVTNHEIVNIDKLNPSITLFSLNAVNRNSATLNVNIVDNESGVDYYEIYKDNVKIGEKRLECYTETTFDEYEACRANFPAERETTYTVTGLTQTTTYIFKIKAFDKAGNFVFSDDLEVTTTTPRIVARLIGYNNSLFTDTVDENTGAVITPKEDKYINFESLEEAFDYEDLYDCKNVQCTIQMVTGTNESVQVLEGQNLTLDLNGQVVSGISEEYTIKNNGDFTLIESTQEGLTPGKLINTNGVALLNKTGSHFTMGEGYSDRLVSNSLVSTTKPYIYGETVGVKSEANAYFTMFDGKIVAPQSQTPGYGAVNGRVTGTEYSYAAVSNPMTDSGRDYQVVTLNVLVSPEARINESVYYSKLGSAMEAANRGTTTIGSSANESDLITQVQSSGKYTFTYDTNTNTLVSNNGPTIGDYAESYLVVDLRNETNDKVLNIEYNISGIENTYCQSSFNFWEDYERAANIKAYKYNNYLHQELGNEITPYVRDYSNTKFTLEKGEIYYISLKHASYKNYYGDSYCGELTINNITLGDSDINTRHIEPQSDVDLAAYGFYYDESDKTIKSSNQYNPETSSAVGYIEVDLTDKEGTYEVIADVAMESYGYVASWNTVIRAEGIVRVGPDKQPTYGDTLASLYSSSSSEYVDVYNNVDYGNGYYGGYTTRTTAGRVTIEGGRKYYIKFAYKKRIDSPDDFPSRAEFEAANCRDQLIIKSLDVVKVSEEPTNVGIGEVYDVDTDILDQFVANSNGGIIVDSNGKVSTKFTQPNQTVATYATIDLTNDTRGLFVAIDFIHKYGKRNGSSFGPDEFENLYGYNEPTCTSCFEVFQKRTSLNSGTEAWVRVRREMRRVYNYDIEMLSNTAYFSLEAGYEYKIVFSLTSSDNVATEYADTVINGIRAAKLSNMIGNNYNGLIFGYEDEYPRNWIYDNYTPEGITTNNVNQYIQENKYKDSFVRIDLTNATKDQILTYKIGSNSSSYSTPITYITNNNRSLTYSDAFENRSDLTSYREYTGYGAGIVLEKGKVYYFHSSVFQQMLDSMQWNEFYSSDEIDFGPNMEYMRLIPIDETVLSVGGFNVLTGTENIADEREESSTIRKRNAGEPIINDSGSSTYGFEYNEETGWYTGLNPLTGDIAVKKFVIDLTNATADKIYVLERDSDSYYDYYSYGDDESKIALDVNTLATIYGGDPVNNYTHFSDSTSISFVLKKGKVNYVQFATRKEYDSQSQTSIRLKEIGEENPTSEHTNIEVVREFNTQVDTVQLLRNVNTPNKLVVENSEEVVLDLNGYSLTSNTDYVIDNFGDLTVVDTKYERALASYDSDLAEYLEYAGLCDGCTEPSDEYKLDHILDYADEFGITFDNIDPADVTEFSYTGDAQTFTVPETGLYKLQVWGAQGGYRSNANYGGKGGYSEGIIELHEGETIYVYVGGSGNTGGIEGGFNGGGSREEYPGGGGATDIRAEGSTLDNRIIVAGGGGSDGAPSKPGKAGGGENGISATESYGDGGTGGTQTSPGTGGSYGRGGTGSYKDDGYGGAGGGGWYGGGSSTPDYSGDDDRGGGGGSGFVLTSNSITPDTYTVTNHTFLSGTTIAGNQDIPTYDGTSTMTGNSGDGYAKISLILGNEYEEMKNNLQKTYNVKSEPVLGAKSIITNDSGTGIIQNRKDATLTINNVILDVNSTEGIRNDGTLIATSEPVINVYNSESTGIINNGGNIVNNGNLKIILNASSCSSVKEYGATGIKYINSHSELSNVEITGQNGTGILINEGSELDLHSSTININDDCDWTRVENTRDDYTSQSLYNKSYETKLKLTDINYDNIEYDRNDGVIYNRGIIRVDNGSTLTGQITNFGNASLYNGVGFKDIFQNNKYKFGFGYNENTYSFDNTELNIYNTVAEVDSIANFGGTLNIIEEDGYTSTITSTAEPAILNFGTVNTTGADISSMYNVGELNTNGTNFGTLNNLLTFIDNVRGHSWSGVADGDEWITRKGTANINGGSITGTSLVNESTMVVNGTTVPTGIINRNNLTVKGNSVITGDDKPAIDNRPFTIYYWKQGIVRPSLAAYGYLKATVTIGDDDGNVSNGPTITTTSNKYAITGTCNSHGTKELSDIQFVYGYKLSHSYEWGTTVASDINGRPVLLSGDYYDTQFTLLNSMDYPTSSNNLCEVNYYDGSIQNTAVTDMTDVMDIPINNIASGYDVLYDNSGSVGQISLATIDNSSRANVIDVNGTSYKSLETAISEAPDNSVINISGNYNSANRVTIPEGKNLTINYASGSKVNSYSKNGLINNNGTLSITGTGTDNIIGEFGYVNNGTMTFNGSNNTNNVDNYFKQSNLIKNNANLTIDNVSSSGLDIVSISESNESRSALTINNGSYNSNTIYGNNTDITVTGGYFDTAENNNYYESWKDDSLTQVVANLKPLFNVSGSTVTINNFDTNNDSRYSSISQEQSLGVFKGSTLNLNNSKFGGRSSRPQIYASMSGGNIVNVSGGQYDNVYFNLFGGNTYNQTSGTVNGELVVAGSGNILNITGGKIISSETSGILLNNASDTTITVGTKGDLIAGTNKLNVSKTDPEIRGSTYGISAGGTETSPNNLYFYDGIFKGSDNPIEMHVEEIEAGYDIAYRRDTNPREKYLDILPLILNYTTGVYYFDVQLAFNEANTNDKLIWVRDYTNFADSPSFVIPAGKQFELYFSYTKASDTPYFYQYQSIDPADRVPVTTEFIPYSGNEPVQNGYTVGTSRIKINNIDTIDSNTGEKVEVPFIINNGTVHFVGMPNYSSSVEEPIFESVSGARIITNNGTAILNRISASNIKALGTMFKNNENATMTIFQGHFETLQANVFTNSGTINFEGDVNDSSTCFNPTYIKVNTTDNLENDYDYYVEQEHNDVHIILSESIINNAGATMNIEYLYYDADYSYVAILNNGSIDISDSTIEAIDKNDDSYGDGVSLRIESIIKNNGTMTMDNARVVAARGIDNRGTLTITGGMIDCAYPASISNRGTLDVTGTQIKGGGKGILDTDGTTTLTGVNVLTRGEAYHGTGVNPATINGGILKTYGLEEYSYRYNYSFDRSCTNNNSSKVTINNDVGTESKGYYINNGAIYIADGKNLNIANVNVGFDDSLRDLAHFCGDYTVWINGTAYRAHACYQPYSHSYDLSDNPTNSQLSTRGLNYSVAAIEASYDSVVTIEGNSSINSATNVRYYTYGLYVHDATVIQKGGYIDKTFFEANTTASTIGVKDGVTSESNYMNEVSCSKDFSGFNFYGGSIVLNPGRLCHFVDKEDGSTIYTPNSSESDHYVIGESDVIVNTNTDTPYTSVQAAINAASSGDTLKMLSSVSEITTAYDINVNKDITFDLNGKLYDANLVIDNNAVVTITDDTYINDNTNIFGRLVSITNTLGTVSAYATIDELDNASQFTLTGGSIKEATNTGTLNVNGGTVKNTINDGTVNVNGTYITDIKNNYGTGTLTLVSGEVKGELLNYGSLSLDSDSKIYNLINITTTTTILSTGTISNVDNYGELKIEGASIGDVRNSGNLVVNSGTINGIVNDYFSTYGTVSTDTYTATINGGTIDDINNVGNMTINNGTIKSVTNSSDLIILGGQFTSIRNGKNGYLTIGSKDGIVNSSSPLVVNTKGYAIVNSGQDFNFYDGKFVSNKPIVIDAQIDDVETDYVPYIATDYDEQGYLTGTYSMTLRGSQETDIKIACVEGICYATLQEAINASVLNYTEEYGCPEVKIGDEFFFSVELTEDLVLDPQYSLTINLNYHNLNDNGYVIPDNITLRNGSLNGTDLQSNISKLLSNIFGINDNGKDIIITRMEDGNALDTSKTYNLYKYEGGSYELVKVNSDGAGKYVIGRKTTDLKPIKGRIYINDLDSGEYKLVDNYNNELQFTIYDDGTLSPNIRENIISDFGHMSASSVATLVISIQTGILRINYMLIAISIIAVLFIMFVLKRKSDTNN